MNIASEIRAIAESLTCPTPEAVMQVLEQRGIAAEPVLITMVLKRMGQVIRPSSTKASTPQAPRSRQNKVESSVKQARSDKRTKAKPSGKKRETRPEKLRTLLTSAKADGILLGLQLLEAAGERELWRAVCDRGVAYSLCCFSRNYDLPFPEVMEAEFSRKSTKALAAACTKSIHSRESRQEFDQYDKLRLCQTLSPIGVDFFSSAKPPDEPASKSDAPFVTAALGGALGQVLWRDLALQEALVLYYEPSAEVGDRLMPDWRYHLAAEDEPALDSFGCQFICSPGASYSLPWISQECFIDPEAIRTFLFFHEFYEDDWHADLSPGFSIKGLVWSALEGLCSEHLVLSDTTAFDKKIIEAFTDYGSECETVRITVLDKPVHKAMPLGGWADIGAAKQEWLINCLLTAVNTDAYPEPAALAKHVLCWMTRHPATPPEYRTRLSELGFGIEIRERDEAASAKKRKSQPQPKRPDAAELKRLRTLVKAWRKLCEAEFPDGLEKEDFLAAHYAQLVICKDAALTKAGRGFVSDREDGILEAAEAASDDE